MTVKLLNIASSCCRLTFPCIPSFIAVIVPLAVIIISIYGVTFSCRMMVWPQTKVMLTSNEDWLHWEFKCVKIQHKSPLLISLFLLAQNRGFLHVIPEVLPRTTSPASSFCHRSAFIPPFCEMWNTQRRSVFLSRWHVSVCPWEVFLISEGASLPWGRGRISQEGWEDQSLIA